MIIPGSSQISWEIFPFPEIKIGRNRGETGSREETLKFPPYTRNTAGYIRGGGFPAQVVTSNPSRIGLYLLGNVQKKNDHTRKKLIL